MKRALVGLAILLFTAVAVVLLFLTGRGDIPSLRPVPTTKPSATADLQPVGGSNVSGVVTFNDSGAEGVRVDYRIQRLPSGVHRLGIHDSVDCAGVGTAGVVRELGALPSSETGYMRGSFTSKQIAIVGGEKGVVGNPLVVVSVEGGFAVVACGVVRGR